LRIVEATGTPEFSTISTSVVVNTDPEKAEVEWLLTSGVLGRAVNLVRVLKYICGEHFQGRADQIKEYTIATEALGRRQEFDPQTDTIVRVTVHALRKRLLEIYQHEGATRPLRLVIPPGRYAPSFLHRRPDGSFSAIASEPPAAAAATGANGSSIVSIAKYGGRAAEPTQVPSQLPSHLRAWILIGLITAITAGSTWMEVKKIRPSAYSAPNAPPASALIRALMGTGGRTYIDHSGNTWATGNYCQEGTNVAVPPQRIEGTEDAPLYLNGVRGIAHCIFPVKPGFHELHFYLAETSDLQAATSVATVSVNAAPGMNIDVVDDAGGDGIATSTVVTGVAPENDGTIHVDFISEVSLLNAIEILPAPSRKQLPVRIVANSQSFADSANQVWSSDRFFRGGRRGLAPKQAGQGILGIYESDRVGKFRYDIPAVPMAHYRVKLYFREPWFGRDNGANGGPGSRVFSVACNGVLLLKNFDILAEGDSQPVVKTLEHVQADAAGRMELSFMPVVNNPLIDAIEILPED
jgi:Malectin domain